MAIEIITKEDLCVFKNELLNDLKALLSKEASKPKKWLRTREVISMFNISPGTLQNYRIQNLIPFTKIGNTLYYPLEEIEEILNKEKSFNR
jgi:hypothetical protein